MNFHPNTCYQFMSSPWGNITLAASPTGLSGVWFENQQHFPETGPWTRDPHHPFLKAAEKLLINFAKGQWHHGLSARQILKDLPLDLQAGTVFQQAVWHALMAIPLGQTCSYGQVAAAIGKPIAVRAVGSAIGRNPISVLIPCHRVLGSQGQMTGYAGGIWRKKALLNLEASQAS
jgi:methylated-DNA-[protein]-cysteine S-methyltransferase